MRNSSTFENEFLFSFVPHRVDVPTFASENKIIAEMKIQISKMMLKVKILQQILIKTLQIF